MWPPKVILHPTDFSECSARAFELTCDIARQASASVIVAHAHFPSAIARGEAPIPVELETEREAQRHLDGIRPPEGVTIERLLLIGTAVQSILDSARDMNADLIVMGTHGRSGLKRFALGSVAEQVVRRANCPVLLTRPLEAKRHIATETKASAAATARAAPAC